MSEQVLISELNQLPKNIRQEALDFIGYLVSKYKVANKKERKKPKFGSAKGKYKMSADFDAPLEDFKDYM